MQMIQHYLVPCKSINDINIQVDITTCSVRTILITSNANRGYYNKKYHCMQEQFSLIPDDFDKSWMSLELLHMIYRQYEQAHQRIKDQGEEQPFYLQPRLHILLI